MYKFEKYGVPQTRHRIIIVGIRNDLDAKGIKFKVPSPELYIHCDITSGTALSNIPDDAPNNEIRKLQDTVKRRLSYIKPGQNIWQAENLPPKLMIKTRTKISQIYRKLDPNKPSYTVTAAGGFGKSIDKQIQDEVKESGMHGSRITVSNFIKMIENHQNGVRKYSHRDLRSIFSLDRQVALKDVCENSFTNDVYGLELWENKKVAETF